MTRPRPVYKQTNTPRYRQDRRVIVYVRPRVKKALLAVAEAGGTSASQAAAAILRDALVH